MELDELKSILNNEIPKDKISEIKLKKRKRWKSMHPAEKIKRKVLYENLLGLIISILILILLNIYNNLVPGIFQIIIISIVILSIIFGFYKVRELTTLLKYSGNTKDFLQSFNKAISGYIKILTVTSLIMFPFGFYIGYTVGYHIGAQMNYQQIIQLWMEQPRHIVLATAIAIPLTFGMYKLVKFIYSKIYGKHIKEIELLIKEFSETN